MLIAEELLLLALDPERGSPVNGSRQPLTAALPGALVAELGLLGAVDVTGRRFTPVPGGRVEHPLLADALEALTQRRGRRSVDQLRRLDRQVGGTWARVVDGLCDSGVLSRRSDRQVFWHVTRHPVRQRRQREEILERLQAAAAGSSVLEPRTAVLLALSGPARLLEVVAPGPDRAHAKRRIREATESTPVAPVVKRVLAEAASAAAAASVAASVAATSG